MVKALFKHNFVFNPKFNGGETVSLTTEFFDNGDKNENSIFTSQKITLQSYTNSASFDLFGCQITPEALRELANQLDQAMNKAKNAHSSCK